MSPRWGSTPDRQSQCDRLGSRQPPESHLTLNGRNILFVNSVKYLGVIFDKKVTWRLHIKITEAKAFRTLEYILYSKVSE
jgi:hypothetical protein